MTGRLFEILGGDGYPSTARVHEEIFSNTLAWLLEPSENPELAERVYVCLLEEAGLEPGPARPATVERECSFTAGAKRRRADVVLKDAAGRVLAAIEVKTDRDYEDAAQLRDYRTWLGKEPFLVLLSPRRSSLLRSDTRKALKDARSGHASWAAFTQGLVARTDLRYPSETTRVLLRGLRSYAEKQRSEDFSWALEELIARERWELFYAHEFEAAYTAHFPEQWEALVTACGGKVLGNGGARQKLQTKLGQQPRVSAKRRLVEKADGKRAPEGWSHHWVSGYRVLLRQ